MKKTMECPYCDGNATLQKESKELTYRKEAFKIIAHFYKCEKCLEEFTTEETDDISLTQAHNQYREKYSIPFQEEIAAIRNQYELSSAKMSEVLGLGANGYSNYEKGEMPNLAMANLISTAADPIVFKKFLVNACQHFSESAYKKHIQKVDFLIEKGNARDSFYLSINYIKEPNIYTGFKKPNAEKVAGMLSYCIQKCKPEFNDKLKLNKLLFYSDFCHYKHHGKSINGLSYRAIQYGPVPVNYDNIFTYLENEQIINSEWIRIADGTAREIYKTQADFDASLFLQEELDTIYWIVKRFSETTTWEIVDLSHKEKAWKELEAERQLISYQDFAFQLEAV